ncbi:hypothetical protein PG994_005699 [Apiospora phragmitis]|uniref:Uncharacterized protein n=1 Tax=Apiospora phragmitis TaxID=2905665 RepID=A0ABR1VD24_9PEZI
MVNGRDQGLRGHEPLRRFSKYRRKNSLGASERTTVFLQEDGSTASGGPEMIAAPVLDFDAELAMFTEEPPSMSGANSDDLVWEHAGDCVRISCMRISSADGRKEGWLTPSNTSDPGASASQHACATTRRNEQLNMEQFSREAHKILVPGRIWDGIEGRGARGGIT